MCWPRTMLWGAGVLLLAASGACVRLGPRGLSAADAGSIDGSGDGPAIVDGPTSVDGPVDGPATVSDGPAPVDGPMISDGPVMLDATTVLVSLQPVANQNAVIEGTPIDKVDVDNVTGDDRTNYGAAITYSCRFDRVVDGAIGASALPCSDLGAGATFAASTGILQWTPQLGQLGSFEVAITGTVGAAKSTVIFVLTVVADTRPTGLVIGQTVRVSIGLSGEANGDSNGHTVGLSANGRFVVYTSAASNLVPNDTNGVADVFVTDVLTRQTTRVSVDSHGAQGNGASDGSALGGSQSGIGISDDGYTIAFMSSATNLVASDTNGAPDVFWHDRRTKKTELASRGGSAFGATANGASQRAQVSADGRTIVFQSAGSDLVVGDTNGKDDCFRLDTQTSQLLLVSRDSSGTLGNADCNHPRISSDGNLIAFYSLATNLVANDTNGVNDAFLRNIGQGTTIRLSQLANGTQGDGHSYSPGFSGDLRFVTFHGNPTNLVIGEVDDNAAEDVFQVRLSDGVITRISKSGHNVPQQSDGRSYVSRQSNEGRFVSFNSLATNLFAGKVINNGLMDVFIKDTQTGQVYWASKGLSAALGNGASDRAYISRDGTHVAFESTATNLVSGDANGKKDIFVHRFR